MTMTAAFLGGVGFVTVVGRGLVCMAVIQTWRTTICQSNFTNGVLYHQKQPLQNPTHDSSRRTG